MKPFTRRLMAITAIASAVAGGGLVMSSSPVTASDSNQASYWKDKGAHTAECYKHKGNADHGSVTNDGKAVTLNQFNQNWYGDHWELLVVKSGSVDNGYGPGNAVYQHPSAGVAYFGPLNNGGQQGKVSHWIVCKGITPTATTTTTQPPTTDPPTTDSPTTTVPSTPPDVNVDCNTITVQSGSQLLQDITVVYSDGRPDIVLTGLNLGVFHTAYDAAIVKLIVDGHEFQIKSPKDCDSNGTTTTTQPPTTDPPTTDSPTTTVQPPTTDPPTTDPPTTDPPTTEPPAITTTTVAPTVIEYSVKLALNSKCGVLYGATLTASPGPERIDVLEVRLSNGVNINIPTDAARVELTAQQRAGLGSNPSATFGWSNGAAAQDVDVSGASSATDEGCQTATIDPPTTTPIGVNTGIDFPKAPSSAEDYTMYGAVLLMLSFGLMTILAIDYRSRMRMSQVRAS